MRWVGDYWQMWNKATSTLAIHAHWLACWYPAFLMSTSLPPYTHSLISAQPEGDLSAIFLSVRLDHSRNAWRRETALLNREGPCQRLAVDTFDESAQRAVPSRRFGSALRHHPVCATHACQRETLHTFVGTCARASCRGAKTHRDRTTALPRARGRYLQP